MKRISLLLVFLLSACTTAQTSPNDAKASADPGGQKTFYREGLTQVDFGGLNAVDKERVLQILNSHECDCGCGMSIAKCRVDDKSCNRSPVLAATVVNAIRAGKTDQEALAALRAEETKHKAATAAAAKAPAAQAQPVAVQDIPINGSPSKGPADAPVTVIAFSDFQCPYCQRAAPVADQLLKAYPNDVKLVYKHFPLSFHKNAMRAAVAAVAAQQQGKFWEMHDILFANQRALDDASLRRYAESLGMDMDAYDEAIADAKTTEFINKEEKEGQAAGVRGTPTFFVNGVMSPSWDLKTLMQLVGAAKSGQDVGQAAAKMTAALRAKQADARPQIDYNKVYDIDIAGAPSKGPADAPVVIVEFSDYQ